MRQFCIVAVQFSLIWYIFYCFDTILGFGTSLAYILVNNNGVALYTIAD